MDSLFWTNLNPKIVCEHTRKQFYSRFCYKLVIEAYGSRSIIDTDPDLPIAGHIAARKDRRNQTFSGSAWSGSGWAQQDLNNLNKADPTMLEEMRSIKNGYGKEIRMRIEEPWVQFYTHDEETLKAIATRITRDRANALRLINVSTPESAEQQALLEQGHILVSPASKLEYQYKIILKDGSYGRETLTRVANYLETLGDVVKISKGNKKMLDGALPFIWGCFIYTDDPAISTMISLIAPGMVGKIHELVKT